jgi:hypothetical protein
MNENGQKRTLFLRSEGMLDTSGDFYKELQLRSDASLRGRSICGSADIEHLRARTSRYVAPDWSKKASPEWREILNEFEEYSLDALLWICDDFFLSPNERNVLCLLLSKRGAENELRRRGF